MYMKGVRPLGSLGATSRTFIPHRRELIGTTSGAIILLVSALPGAVVVRHVWTRHPRARAVAAPLPVGDCVRLSRVLK